jgi:hypothetical protein
LRQRQRQQRQRAGHVAGRRQQLREQLGLHRNAAGVGWTNDDLPQPLFVVDRIEAEQRTLEQLGAQPLHQARHELAAQRQHQVDRVVAAQRLDQQRESVAAVAAASA